MGVCKVCQLVTDFEYECGGQRVIACSALHAALITGQSDCVMLKCNIHESRPESEGWRQVVYGGTNDRRRLGHLQTFEDGD